MKKIITILALILVGTIIATMFIGSGETVEETGPFARKVSIAQVNVLGASLSPLPITATVRSNSRADLKTEASGEVVSVYFKVGDQVNAGDVIAEIENSSERALLAQAQAGVSSAQLAVDRARLATAESVNISGAGAVSAEIGLEEAKTLAENAYGDALVSAEGAIYQRLDQFFANATSPYARYKLGGNADKISEQRIEIRDILARWRRNFRDGLIEVDTLALLDQAKADLEFMSSFAVAISEGVNELDPGLTYSADEITRLNVDLVTAKSSITAALGSVSGARASLVSAQSANTIASTQSQQTTSGSASLALSSAEAGLAAAQAGLASASANLERKIVRSPISGEITRLPISVGDFVSAFESAAEVSSENGFEAVGYISASDLAYINVGERAVVDGKYSAVVTSVASSLDERTKKIEVRFGIEDEGARLINGSSVRINLQRSFVQTQQADSSFALPLSTLKVNAENVVVFTVDPDNRLVEHEVELGPLLGDRVLIRRGLEPNMKIVLDARGLSSGDLVELAN